MARVTAASHRTTTKDFTMNRSLLSLASIACMAMAASAVSAFERVRSTITAAWTWLRDVNPIALKQPKPKCHPALVQAKAFVMRQAKRDRPTVMARWRMCPST